jgi:hypothetical protein
VTHTLSFAKTGLSRRCSHNESHLCAIKPINDMQRSTIFHLLLCLGLGLSLCSTGLAQTMATPTGGSLRGTIKRIVWHEPCTEHTSLVGRTGNLVIDKLYVEANTLSGYDLQPIWDLEQQATIVGVRCGDLDGTAVIRVRVRMFDETEGYLEAGSLGELAEQITLSPQLKASK